MISTILSFPQIKQLLFFILLLKVHAQPPFASLNHQTKNELQHHQHRQHQHHIRQEPPQHQQRKQEQKQELPEQAEQLKHNPFDLHDLSLIGEQNSKELKGNTKKNSSLPLITFNLKYPLDYENFNSESFHHLSNKNNNNKNIENILNDQYKINGKNIQIPSISASSIPALKSGSTRTATKTTSKEEEEKSKIKVNKQQLKYSHQQKREVILADVPLWSLQFATIAPTNSNIDSKYNNNETPLSSLSKSKLQYTYNKNPIEEDPDTILPTDENFTSTEISENEINKIFNPNEFLYLKEYHQKKKRRPPFSSRIFSKSSEKPTNKLFIGIDDDGGGGRDDGGGGGGDDVNQGIGITDNRIDGYGRNNNDGNTDENIGHKKIKFYLNSYPFHGERLNVKNKISSNSFNGDGDDSEDYNDFQDIFNNKRITAPPVWMKMLRNRKDGRKPWALVDRKQEIGGGGSGAGIIGGTSVGGGISRMQFFNEPDSKSHNSIGFTRQKLKTHQTQFVPSVSVGAMTNLGDFFDKLKNNVDFMEKSNFNPDAIDIMEGDHLRKISDNIKTEVMTDSGGQTKPTGTAAFLHAIRTYRPSQKVRALVSMTPEGYHGHGTHFSDPNYMWMGLGK
ncbi:myb-like protein P [Condylostylus longicornis]|uniref:myb-like protein P n=1 Tax=Condylostylus longicornis TaxID=2530218 RepID=UPI00244E557E|nr:myb-like protein P [Condylostylus longicornis]